MSLVMRKPAFCICKNKDADQVTAKLISAFVFAIKLVQFLYFLNTKFQAPSHLLWLHSSVCVGPGRKLRRQVFSQLGSNDNVQIKMVPFFLDLFKHKKIRTYFVLTSYLKIHVHVYMYVFEPKMQMHVPTNQRFTI